MPPKQGSKEAAKKPAPQIIRPVISDSSLIYIPGDAVEGYQKRIDSGIDWTLIEEAARHHRALCRRENIPPLTFSKAFRNKLNSSILNGFLDENSSLSLAEHWDLLLPITLWDNEKCANEEGKTCFHSVNCITDNMLNIIKKAVRIGDREVLKKDLKLVDVLRVNDSQMTTLDKGLTEFRNLVTLNLCGNFISELDPRYLPLSLRSLELQANCISNAEIFAEYLPADLLYLGLARNLFTSDGVEGLGRLPHHLTVLDLSNNDIYHLEPVLDALSHLPCLFSLDLLGNPCSYCAAYARTTLNRLQRLKWLDSREILATDRPKDTVEVHLDDLRSAYFFFTVFRVMSAPMPPKPEKGAVTTFHLELEIPLLDVTRRRFLMFRRFESLIELLPPPEDGWPVSLPSQAFESRMGTVATKSIEDEASTHESDIYNHLTRKNSREIHHYTTFESNRVQWNKVMNFQEPTIRIFCPDLLTLRDTFRSVITIRLIYSMTTSSKSVKSDKKSTNSLKPIGEQRVTVATMKCGLKAADWSQPSQHFHWDDTLGTSEAMHWGDGDLSILAKEYRFRPRMIREAIEIKKHPNFNREDGWVLPPTWDPILQYSQGPVKVVKGKQDPADSRQAAPDNLTCHFGFGIETLRAV